MLTLTRTPRRAYRGGKWIELPEQWWYHARYGTGTTCGSLDPLMAVADALEWAQWMENDTK